MKKRIRSTIAALLALLTVAPLAACGSGDAGSAQTTTAAPIVKDTPAETTAPETVDDGLDANGFLRDTLPEDLKLTQTEVSMLYREDVEEPEFFVDGVNGEVINDAIYARNQAVEDRLGIKLSYIGQKGNAGNLKTFVAHVGNSIMTNDYAFDILGGYSQTMANVAYNQYLLDLYNLEYFNFDMPWWPSLLTEEALVNGKLFFASGDISTNLLYKMYSNFFNKQLIKNYNLEDPYQLVKDGKWTLDKMFEMATGVYKDLDGNGTKDKADQFGVIVANLDIDTYFYGSGLRTTDKNEDGTIKISDSYFGERSQELLEKLNRMIFVSEDGIYKGDAANAFAQGRALFYADRAVTAMKTFNVEGLEFGILPAPKWDEAQEEYYTCAGNPFTLYALPINCRQPDQMSAVLECLASEGYRRTTPAIFETSMKVKYSQDEDSAQMYDIIRDAVTFDLGRVFGITMGDMTQTLYRNAVSSGNTVWSSTSAAYKKMLGNYVKRVNEALLNAG